MTITNTSFSTGTILHTSTVNQAAREDPLFALFLMHVINRHKNNDWGDCCETDWEMNDIAISKKNRILSVYHLPQDLKSIHRDEKIWIVTEWDRKYSTVLFPSEY
ncbi:MAG: hypothetical protein P8Q41_05675 [Saprospiraceae bacterium]|nr:hypothetical protein [Saprospiraceae bacterium]